MSSTKIWYVVAMVTGLCVTSVAGPVGPPHIAPAAAPPGGAVLFFTAHMGQLREVLYNPIIFNQVVVNQGSAYDPETGVFTAPVAGIFQFVFAAQLCRGNFNNHWEIMVNGNRRILCHAQVSNGDTSLNTCYYMEDLKKGDRVWVSQKEGSCAWSSTVSRTITFSGVLLASEGRTVLGPKHGSGMSCPLVSVGRAVASSAVAPPTSLFSLFVGLLVSSGLNSLWSGDFYCR